MNAVTRELDALLDAARASSSSTYVTTREAVDAFVKAYACAVRLEATARDKMRDMPHVRLEALDVALASQRALRALAREVVALDQRVRNVVRRVT